MRKRWKGCLSLSIVWGTRERENGRREHEWVRVCVGERGSDRDPFRTVGVTRPHSPSASWAKQSHECCVMLCWVVSVWSIDPSRFDSVYWFARSILAILAFTCTSEAWAVTSSVAFSSGRWGAEARAGEGKAPGSVREVREQPEDRVDQEFISIRPSCRCSILLSSSRFSFLFPIFYVQGLRGCGLLAEFTLISDEMLGHWGGRGMPLVAYFQRILRKADNMLLWHESNKTHMDCA